MNRSCFGFILASFFALQAYAQYSLEECPSTDLEEKVKCLEQRLNELDEHNNIERKRLKAIIKELITQIGNLKGPKKNVELIPEVESAVTVAYWAKGHAHQVFNCVPPIENKEGYTIFGADLSEDRSIVKNTIVGRSPSLEMHAPHDIHYIYYRTCHPNGYCDSKGEHCMRRDRAKGCYVNTEWYNWYLKMNGLQSSIYKINYDTICSQ